MEFFYPAIYTKNHFFHHIYQQIQIQVYHKDFLQIKNFCMLIKFQEKLFSNHWNLDHDLYLREYHYIEHEYNDVRHFLFKNKTIF